MVEGGGSYIEEDLDPSQRRGRRKDSSKQRVEVNLRNDAEHMQRFYTFDELVFLNH